MKVLVIGKKDRYEKYTPDMDIVKEVELFFCPMGTNEDELIEKGGDADILLVDAIATVSKTLIDRMPRLKMIHSEGVAYNGIDFEAAANKGIYVCNNKGINAGAVAEQAILLMLALLRKVIEGHQTVLSGNQIQMKERMMVEGITELSDCKVGLIGFGDIAKATAKRLVAFGAEVFYYSRTRQSVEMEETYQVTYFPLEELAAKMDIISIHVPVTPETKDLINHDFLRKMKKSAYLINTARGEIVDNEALEEALTKGWIQGVGLDTVYPEPITKENQLLHLPDVCMDKIIFSPHIGGITTSTFLRAHKGIWTNVERIKNGERPHNIVNGI